jgi:hypothetical protein
MSREQASTLSAAIFIFGSLALALLCVYGVAA